VLRLLDPCRQAFDRWRQSAYGVRRGDETLIGTFLASETRVLSRLLQDHGLDDVRLLREAGLDPELVGKPRARFPFARVAAAWGLAARTTGDPHLGLKVPKYYRATDFHGLVVVFLASQTLGAALERLVRYHAVVNTAISLRLVKRQDRVDLVCLQVDVDLDARRVMEDARTAILVDLCRSGSSGRLDPLEVAFTYPRPRIPTGHADLFRCPAVFGAPEWGISFAPVDMERPFLASNRELAHSNDHVLGRMVESLRHDDLVTRVKRIVVESLPSGTPSQQAIARSLSMSERSLQRRLAELNTSFKDLLALVRRELAEQYVAERDLPVTEITFMLGFADVSSFSRAFKRWTGRSPAASRHAHASA
jgi:AraC-like DNA-binding protein